ncbi:phosphatidylserine decarboxylase [Lentisphaerota bacterium WC36G]|nr:phosphatidylserine decarboxylase [Lentisphaerae bacterium WC36]
MKLTEYGMREWLSATIVAVILMIGALFLGLCANGFAGVVLGSAALIMWLVVASFFRVPNRKIPSNDAVILSPADGVVRDIELINDDSMTFFEGKNIVRIGIFLSVFDVHVNRAPTAMNIVYKKYKEGRYLDARNPDASKENESMIIGGMGTANSVNFPLAIRQISGAVARKIVCPVEINSSFDKGEVYGMIKFGSRVELYLPADKNITVKVKIGDKVLGGSTVMAELNTIEKELES